MKTIWKVLIGIAIFIVLVITLAFCFTGGVADSAKNELNAMKAGDFAKAYSLTSTEFQKTMTYDEFRKFLEINPILQNYTSFNINSRETNNDMGIVSGELIDANGGKTTIDFNLIKENGSWKVRGVNLGAAPISATPAATSAVTAKDSSTISEIMINDTADSSGYVSENKTVLSKDAAHLYATTRIANAFAGSKATAILEYLNSGEKIGPIDNDIAQSGNMLKAFSFTNTNGQWPEGNYKVTVTLTNGTTKDISFQVK